MSKILMLKGLPASGKSTYAEDLVRKCFHGQGAQSYVRVNRDLLRTMLHADKPWRAQNEDEIVGAEKELVRMILRTGQTAIVDDCNLNPKNELMWREFAKAQGNHQFEMVEFDTPVEICVERDMLREKKVGYHVIHNMALQYNYGEVPTEGIVICDIDGTIADCTHRQHHVKDGNKHWDKFFEEMDKDTRRDSTYEMLLEYQAKGHPIIFVSARPEKYRLVTQRWLADHGMGTMYWTLIMRPDNDSREDSIIKGEIYKRYFKGKGIETVIDDRPRVIRMWRELGLPVIDVGTGIEF